MSLGARRRPDSHPLPGSLADLAFHFASRAGTFQECREFSRVARQTRECAEDFSRPVDDCVERQGNSAERFLLESLLLFVNLAFAIGVETREDKLSELRADIGTIEDVRFHPAAIGTRVAGKVDEDELPRIPCGRQ